MRATLFRDKRSISYGRGAAASCQDNILWLILSEDLLFLWWGSSGVWLIVETLRTVCGSLTQNKKLHHTNVDRKTQRRRSALIVAFRISISPKRKMPFLENTAKTRDDVTPNTRPKVPISALAAFRAKTFLGITRQLCNHRA